jgi:hypothetical protein
MCRRMIHYHGACRRLHLSVYLGGVERVERECRGQTLACARSMRPGFDGSGVHAVPKKVVNMADDGVY